MKNSKKNMKLVWFDLKNSIRYNKFLLLAVLIFFFLASVYYGGNVQQYKKITDRSKTSIEKSEGEAYSSDFVLFFFRGMEPVDEKALQNGDKIEIPLMYIGLTIIFTCITLRYFSTDISRNTIHYCSSRRWWMISKVASNAVMILLVYATGVVFAIIFGKNVWLYNESADIKFCKVSYCNAYGINILKLLGLSFMTAVTISAIQLCISLYINHIAGVIVSITLYIMSLFSTDLLFIANGCMLQRSSYFLEGGYATEYIFVMNTVIFAIVMCIIVCKSRKWDIL